MKKLTACDRHCRYVNTLADQGYSRQQSSQVASRVNSM